MTTAARPTFDPAKGKANNELTYLTSAKDLPSHTRLKTRKSGQGGEQEKYTVDELKRELEVAEQKHFAAKRQLPESGGVDVSEELEATKMKYIEMAQLLDAESSEEEEESGSEEDSDSDDSDDSDDSEDETAMLMKELEKIKRERAEEKAREKAEQEEPSVSALDGNPLLGKERHNFAVKRRWDDDTVFKNQARTGNDGRPKKRFINDMLRSDFHRKFMKKYIQ